MSNATDVFGKDISALKNKKLFLFDMDGTIYSDDNLYHGAKELFDMLNSDQYFFITNNSSKSVKEYVVKLKNLGIDSTVNNFFTSAQASIMYIHDNYPQKKVFCVGTKALIEELAENDVQLCEENPDVVLVGFDTELTYEKLSKACNYITGGAEFLATNIDLVCPTSFGFVPDCGSICQTIENSTRKKPYYIGKPNRIMVDEIVKKSNFTYSDVVVVGDRLYTDIATGVNASVTTVCVLTGEATIDEISNSEIKPTFTLENVDELYKLLAETKV